MSDKPFITRQRAAEILGISVPTLKGLIASGEIPVVPGMTFLRLADVQAYAKGGPQS